MTSFSFTAMNTFPKLKVLVGVCISHLKSAENSQKYQMHSERLMKAREMQKIVSWRERKNKAFVCFCIRKAKKKKINRHTFSKWVKCVNHELEDAVPH